MKHFKSIDEQIELLRRRGMIVGDNAKIILLRENYYSVVNGYKDPFLDKEAMQEHADDVYRTGVKFDELFALFQFDRELRNLTFTYLIRAEAALKTATVYAFCESHRGCSDYCDRSSFVSARDMLVPKHFSGNKAKLHKKNLNSLIKTLNKKLQINPSSKPFTAHYIKTHSEVPLWVLVNDLTFGNMHHFFQLMRRSEQNAVCKYLYKTTLRTDKDKKINPHEVLRTYDVLVYFRNLCAHDERLYCAKKDTDSYPDMLHLLEIALPKATVQKLRGELNSLLEKYQNNLFFIENENLIHMLGITNIR